MNSDPMPAMPARRERATAADITAYNAWADRNGQPRWDAAAAPKAAPKRRGRPGAPVPAPPAHGVVANGEEGGGWQRGTWWANRTEYARKTNGHVYRLRTWSSRTSEYNWRAAGRDYYNHNRQKFIINVPCLGYISPSKIRGAEEGYFVDTEAASEVNTDGAATDDPLLRSTYYGRLQSSMIFPMIPEQFGDTWGRATY